jgi:hypothetical protein
MSHGQTKDSSDQKNYIAFQIGEGMTPCEMDGVITVRVISARRDNSASQMVGERGVASERQICF